MSDKVKEAFDTLKQAMIDDPDYAYSWHCNLAMSFMDELEQSKSSDAHVICNDAASRFMELCFDADTKFKEPCEGCNSAPVDCVGHDKCEKLK